MTYSIDTSALLDGWVRYYPQQVFPGVWDRMEDIIERNILRATEEVQHEVKKKDDDLFKWVTSHPQLIIPHDEALQHEVRDILAQHERLVESGKNRTQADAFVIAVAKLSGATVVSGETRSYKQGKEKIPNVCDALGLKCISLLDMFRDLGWRFPR